LIGLRVRTWLWWGLGAFWILDGLLSLQRDMALSQLYIVTMSGWGEPRWYVHLINDSLITYVYNHHLAAALDLAVFGIQVGLGLLFWVGRERRLGRIALYASLGWAVLVWLLAEWMGALFAGMSFFVGGPGSVLLYAAGAVGLLIGRGRFRSPRFLAGLGRVLGAAWAAGTLLQALPFWWRAPNLSEAVRANLVLTPVSVRTVPIGAFVAWSARDPVGANLVLVLAMACISALLLWRPERRSGYAALILWAIIVWWMGENFGGLLGGVGTDPNTGALWILFGLAMLSAIRSPNPGKLRQTRPAAALEAAPPALRD
jgi:hypothetical protein